MAEGKNLPQVVATPQRWQDSKARKLINEMFSPENVSLIVRGIDEAEGEKPRMAALPSSIEEAIGAEQPGAAFQYWLDGQKMRAELSGRDAVDCRIRAAEAVETMKERAEEDA